MTRTIKSQSNLLADLARAKALFQQRAVVAILTAGAPGSNPDQICRHPDEPGDMTIGGSDDPS